MYSDGSTTASTPKVKSQSIVRAAKQANKTRIGTPKAAGRSVNRSIDQSADELFLPPRSSSPLIVGAAPARL